MASDETLVADMKVGTAAADEAIVLIEERLATHGVTDPANYAAATGTAQKRITEHFKAKAICSDQVFNYAFGSSVSIGVNGTETAEQADG